MEKLLTGLLILFFGASVHAQDIIVKNNGNEIKADVKEITIEDVIKYKRYNHLEGPVRNIRTDKVFMIIYDNGKREIFKEEQDSLDEPAPSQETSSDTTKANNTKETSSTKDQENTSDTNQDSDNPKSIDDSNDIVSADEKDEAINNDPAKSKSEYFFIGAGHGTRYGFNGASIGYKFGTIALHGGYSVFNGFEDGSYSIGALIYFSEPFFVDIQYFTSTILNDFDIGLNGATLQSGADIHLGETFAITGSAGLAYYFDLNGSAFTYNVGGKLKF